VSPHTLRQPIWCVSRIVFTVGQILTREISSMSIRQTHWENVHTTKPETAVSWYTDDPKLSQKSEIRSQKSEVRDQKSEVRRRKSDLCPLLPCSLTAARLR